MLDFDIKRRYFRTELERLDEGIRREDLAVHVRRDAVFEESFRELHRCLLYQNQHLFLLLKVFHILLNFLGAVQRNGRTGSTLSLRGKRDKMLEDS